MLVFGLGGLDEDSMIRSTTPNQPRNVRGHQAQNDLPLPNRELRGVVHVYNDVHGKGAYVAEPVVTETAVIAQPAVPPVVPVYYGKGKGKGKSHAYGYYRYGGKGKGKAHYYYQEPVIAGPAVVQVVAPVKGKGAW